MESMEMRIKEKTDSVGDMVDATDNLRRVELQWSKRPYAPCWIGESPSGWINGRWYAFNPKVRRVTAWDTRNATVSRG